MINETNEKMLSGFPDETNVNKLTAVPNEMTMTELLAPTPTQPAVKALLGPHWSSSERALRC